jgi:hypothetical protein
MSDFHAMEPVWQPCGAGCACNALTMVCWGPVDAEIRELDAEVARIWAENALIEAREDAADAEV